jgi:hypothetical protein
MEGLYFDYLGKCVKKCGDYYFKNDGEDFLFCDKCPRGCKTCESKSLCYTCDVGYQLNAWDVCEECDDNCISCAFDECLECEAGFLKEDGFCVVECRDGLFAVLESSVCEYCPDECSTCTSYDTCTSCKKGYELNSFDEC